MVLLLLLPAASNITYHAFMILSSLHVVLLYTVSSPAIQQLLLHSQWIARLTEWGKSQSRTLRHISR